MRRNALSWQKKFSTRWRHLYISASCEMGVVRSAFEGITAVAPRSFKTARSALLSNALSAMRASNSRPVISGFSSAQRAELPVYARGGGAGLHPLGAADSGCTG